MKVTNVTDIDGFFKMIGSCKGKVELVTGEGDCINLKSKLSQFVALAKVFSSNEIPELELVAYDKEDVTRIMDFMMRQDRQVKPAVVTARA